MKICKAKDFIFHNVSLSLNLYGHKVIMVVHPTSYYIGRGQNLISNI